jgi:uncharacterized protein with PIN domain
MLGFDTVYRNDFDDDALAEISSREQRILLTRDRGLLKRSVVTHGYCIRKTRPKMQVVEVLKRFDLLSSIKPFRRCIRCNGMLDAVEKEKILNQLPPKTQEYYDEYHRCDSCGQIYWKGSHYDRMLQIISGIVGMVDAMKPADNEVSKDGEA